MGKLTTIIILFLATCLLTAQEVREVLVTGYSDASRDGEQRDRLEAITDAKRQACEQAGIEIASTTTVENFQTIHDLVESRAKVVLMPGFTIKEIGYKEDGVTYSVVLAGKIRTQPARAAAPPVQVDAADPPPATIPAADPEPAAVPESPPALMTGADVPLRATPHTSLSDNEVFHWLRRSGRYDKRKNAAGACFDNHYVVQADSQVVIDKASGLYWQRSGSPEKMDYQAALAYVTTLNEQGFAGYHDWRLPTLDEALSLLDIPEERLGMYIDARFDGQQRWIWCADRENESRAWTVSYLKGLCGSADTGYYSYVRAVRSGQ